MSHNTQPMSGPPGGGGPHGPPGPPYPPSTAALGGTPSPSLDVPITAVFLGLFILGAAGNMAIMISNRRRGHKFLMTNLCFGFCMARTVTCVMRIVWAYRLRNIQVGIAAMIFVQAGVLLLIIVNLIFTQRLIRASCPQVGWHKSISIGFNIFYISVVLLLGAIITCVVQSFYTLNPNIIQIDIYVEHVGTTFFAAAAFLPIPVIIIGYFLPKPSITKLGDSSVDKFGAGTYRAKVRLLLLTSILLTLGASFRAGIAYVPRPLMDPAWYHDKTCFYTINFTIEIIVVFLYIIMRIDRRFYVPDGAKGPGDYSGGYEKRRLGLGIMSEEMFWDFGAVREEGLGDLEMAAQWAKALRAELESRFSMLEKEEWRRSMAIAKASINDYRRGW